MESIGKTITDNRKRLNLTQKDLGERLNVTAQAVSKWENGQAEPDASTIRKLCEIFKISTDELLGITPPAEAAATSAEPVVVPEQPLVERVVEQKIINGYCERCKKPVGPGEYEVETYGRGGTVQHIYCKKCKNVKDLQDRYFGALREYKQIKKENILSVSLGLPAIAVMFVIFYFSTLSTLGSGGAAGIGAAMGIAYGSFIIQVCWDDSVMRDFFFFFVKAFKMPGVIFTLDWGGIFFLLFWKVIAPIFGFLLSIIVFIFGGLIFTPIASVFVLPFAAIKRSAQTAKAKNALTEIHAEVKSRQKKRETATPNAESTKHTKPDVANDVTDAARNE